ncbi:MAG TPA: site-2 protease family protein [Blastocatellia bacterium]|nr:site-2 protease family protein [Blastocatellia bacterium]
MKIFGIPVRVRLFFFVMMIALGYNLRGRPEFLVAWVAAAFVSVLIHEFGHALTVRAFGGTPEIELYGMGGLTRWSIEQRLSPLRQIIVSLAGPFAGLVAGVVVVVLFFVLRLPDGLGRSTLNYLMWTTIGWSVLNLIPMLPLDGGNVVRSLEELITGRPDAKFTRIISIALAVGVACIGLFVLGDPWFAIIGGFFAFNNVMALMEKRDDRPDSSLRPLLNQAREAARREDSETAIQIGHQVLASAKSHPDLKEAMELLVYGYLQRGELDKARGQFDQMRSLYGPDDYLEGFLLLSEGNGSQAIAVLDRSFRSKPVDRVGYLLGQALVRSGRFEEALLISQNPQLGDLSLALAGELESAAFQAGHYDVAAQAGAIAFRRTRDPRAAYNVVCALARAGRAEEALGWLRSAVQAGFTDKHLLETDPDLIGIRGLPGFSQIVASIA